MPHSQGCLPDLVFLRLEHLTPFLPLPFSGPWPLPPVTLSYIMYSAQLWREWGRLEGLTPLLMALCTITLDQVRRLREGFAH